jgi:flagellar protein FlaG
MFAQTQQEISATGPAKPSPAPVHAPAAAPTPAPAAAAPSAVTSTGDSKPVEEVPKFEPLVSTEERLANLREAIQRLNDMMRESSRNLNFSMDEATDRVVITVKNANTGEVVRQIPDATFLRVSHNLENLKGVLLNEST